MRATRWTDSMRSIDVIQAEIDALADILHEDMPDDTFRDMASAIDALEDEKAFIIERSQ